MRIGGIDFNVEVWSKYSKDEFSRRFKAFEHAAGVNVEKAYKLLTGKDYKAAKK